MLAQVDMSTTRKYGGSGLGLNLVKQLVEAHGGTIGVRSKLGRGTSFFFSLKVKTMGLLRTSPFEALLREALIFPEG